MRHRRSPVKHIVMYFIRVRIHNHFEILNVRLLQLRPSQESLTASSLKALLKVFRFVVIRHLQRYYPLSWVSMKCGVLQYFKMIMYSYSNKTHNNVLHWTSTLTHLLQ